MEGRLPPEIHCVVTVANPWSSFPEAQPALETLCNLLARFCPRVTVVTTAENGVPNGERLVAMMAMADPYGSFRLDSKVPPADLRIHLGPETPVSSAVPTICWGFSGWQSFVAPAPSSMPDRGDVESRPGAELAACLAAAMAFRFWADRSLSWAAPFAMDLFTMSEAPFARPSVACPITLPGSLRILMVGAGSVGSAAAYFLPRLGFCGLVDVVDHDFVKVVNMDRSPIFFLSDADKKKAQVVAKYLTDAGIASHAFPYTWSGFVERKYPMRQYDLWLPLANEYGVRRSMQANYPPRSVQASTGTNWNVSYGRHIPFVDDCQLDRFPSEPAGPLACGAGQVVTDAGHKEDAAFPFCSFIAGLFVAAGVRRAATGAELAAPNSASLFFRPRFSLWSSDRRPRPTCACTSMEREIWGQFWK